MVSKGGAKEGVMRCSKRAKINEKWCVYCTFGTLSEILGLKVPSFLTQNDFNMTSRMTSKRRRKSSLKTTQNDMLAHVKTIEKSSVYWWFGTFPALENESPNARKYDVRRTSKSVSGAPNMSSKMRWKWLQQVNMLRSKKSPEQLRYDRVETWKTLQM